MNAIRGILVAVRDPQARTLPALTKAAQLAASSRASIELFHCIDTQISVDMLGGDEDIIGSLQRDVREAALQGLERLADRLRRTGLRVTVSAEWDFPLHEAVIRRALLTRADFIVAHQHGKHRFPHLLHHTDWELLRESPVPVLLIRSRGAYRATAVLAAVDPAHAFAKPAALDAQILARAQAAANALSVPLHVVHAFLPLPSAQNQGKSYYVSPVQIEQRAQQHAQKALNKALAARGVSASRRHLVEGHPAQVIPAIARRLRASMVVMGAVSRSGWKRLLIGNTAERIIDELSCDLLIVKPSGFAANFPRRRRGAWFVPAPTQF